MDKIEQLKDYVTNYGMFLVPLPPKKKFPTTEGWGNNCLSTASDVEDFYTKYPEWGAGVSLGPSKVCSLDIDCLQSFQIICNEMGIDIQELKKYPIIQGSKKGFRVLFALPDTAIQYQKLNWKDENGKSFTVFEMRAADTEQRQDVLPPSTHPSGDDYKWLTELKPLQPPPFWLQSMWSNWDKFKPQMTSICPNIIQPIIPEPIISHHQSSDCVFTAWNQAHSLRSTLEQYGYRSVGSKRYVSPHSSTGLAGVVLFDDDQKCWIHHASDPLCSDDTGKPVGAFDLFCEYEHQGNIANAAKAARNVLDMPSKVVSMKDTVDVSALLASTNAEPVVEDEWLVWADDFCQDFKAINWLIKGWLPRDSSIMLFGPSGTGKTFLILDWCLSIASRGFIDSWQGKKVRHGVVVYLAGEGHHGLKGRIKAWRQHNNYHGKLDIIVSKSGCDLNTQQGFDRVCKNIDRLGVQPAAIVVDTLHRFFDGDENSAKDSRSMLNVCVMLQQRYTSSSTILIHHTGVSGEKRARGSASWKGAMEVELSLSHESEAIALECTKGKDTRAPDKTFFDLKQIELDGLFDEDNEQVTSAVIVQVDEPEKPKKASKTDKYLQQLLGGWKMGGCEVSENRPYISRSALMNFCESMGESPASIKQKMKPSAEGKLIYELLYSGLIEQFLHGYRLLDNVISSAWMISNDYKVI